jgi:hypothetical protein
VNVEPPRVPPTFGWDHKILQVICSDPGNFSTVLAIETERKKKKVDESLARVLEDYISQKMETSMIMLKETEK